MGRPTSCNCNCIPPRLPPCCPTDEFSGTLYPTLHLTFDDSGTCDLLDGETFELTYSEVSKAWLTPEFGDCSYWDARLIPAFLQTGATAGFFFGCDNVTDGCQGYYVAGHFGGSNQSWFEAIHTCTCNPPMFRFENAQVGPAFEDVFIQYSCCDCCNAIAQFQNCNGITGIPGFLGDSLYLPNCTVTA